MVDISFELRGKKVKLEDLEAVEREALKTVAHNVANVLGSVTCPEHGISPEVIVRGDESVRFLEFRVRGCCAHVVNLAMDQLRDPQPGEWWLKGPVPKDWWEKGI